MIPGNGAPRPNGGRRRVGVVGAGIVGLAVARRLAEVCGDEVTVFEKETEVATHQTGRNSGVVHSGLYYKPGSLKAVLCRRGVELLREFCAQKDLEYREIGKVVVARDAQEVERLRDLEARARANGVPGIAWLEPQALREIEPHVRGVAALHSPTTAIVDYRAIARALADDLAADGGKLLLGQSVTDIRPEGSGVAVYCGDKRSRDKHSGAAGRGADERHVFDHLVLCAGLHSDTLARRAGDDKGPAIVPFRGEYFRLVPQRADLVRGLVYPVPDPAYPFLGVHMTPRIDGSVDVGPNAVLALAREAYRRRDVNPRDLIATLTWPGALRLFAKHWRMGALEMYGSLSKRAFTETARAYVPDLTPADLVRAPAGVRAQAVDRDGGLVDDFRISFLGPVTAVRNAPSPAATSSLAIAEHVVDRLLERQSGC
ncbi:MAG TPA: L-2-hydroxyglutarate oxidase [Actinocrinis sp.]|uniref:L-2-hydroxyglutarate oxidase n=1 Tax=Actinocrinis sp. TaxID=1920516 RepID=UPI002D27CF3B|nr:L-2-hydroxyglutarate oxidase [Actinocrinis sp.]HZU57362.1 L-2-hydroxyglutarate oxidase [Actinocrinis sp.]